MADSSFQCRRNNSQVNNSLWNNLSISQRFSAGSLLRNGYNLTFIRNIDNESIAILLCGNDIVTVNIEGDINTNPEISIR